jgi:hypothetical protein
MSDEEAAGLSQQPAGDGETQIAAPKLPNLSKKRLKKLHDKEKAKGVVYLSRIPPHLVSGGWCMQVWCRLAASCAQLLPPASLPQKPQKLRQLLQQYAEIGRVYLAPEGAPPAAAATPCTPAVARTGELQGGSVSGPCSTPASVAARLAADARAEQDFDEDELLLARMDAGLYTLQQVGGRCGAPGAG